MHRARAPAAAVAGAALGFASCLAPAANLTLEVTEEQVELDADDVALSRVLATLGERSGVRTIISPAVEARVTTYLSGLPVPKAFQRLTRNHATVMVFETASDGSDRLVEIRIYGKTSAAPAPQRRRLPPAVAVAPDGPSEPDAEDEPLEALGRTLQTATDSSARAAAASELAIYGSERAVELLANALGDSDEQVQRQVILGLAAIGNNQAAIALGQVIHGEDSPKLRLLAVESLAEIDNEPARHFLESALKDPDKAVQTAARLALSR